MEVLTQLSAMYPPAALVIRAKCVSTFSLTMHDIASKLLLFINGYFQVSTTTLISLQRANSLP